MCPLTLPKKQSVKYKFISVRFLSLSLYHTEDAVKIIAMGNDNYCAYDYSVLIIILITIKRSDAVIRKNQV